MRSVSHSCGFRCSWKMLRLHPLGAKSTSLGFLFAFVGKYQRQKADWAENKAWSWRKKCPVLNGLCSIKFMQLQFKNFLSSELLPPALFHHLSRCSMCSFELYLNAMTIMLFNHIWFVYIHYFIKASTCNFLPPMLISLAICPLFWSYLSWQVSITWSVIRY